MSMMVAAARFVIGADGPTPYSDVFSYSGAYQEVTVPSGYDSVLVRLWGAAGGNGNWNTGAFSGAGGVVAAIFPVSPGDTLKVEVGQGGRGAARGAAGGAGGWPDGGPGGRGDAGSGGGGGSSRFYRNGTLKAVAGGGGGSGGLSSAGGAGAGGGATGQSAQTTGGTGGTSSAGGVDANDTGNANKTGRSIVSFPGVQRTGGYGSANGDPSTLSTDDGGGGGGGYWGGGGGGGDAQSGGGGSSWTDSDATTVLNSVGAVQTPATPCRSDATIATGVNSGANGAAVAGGNGRIEIFYLSGVDGTLGQTSGTTAWGPGADYNVVIPVTVPAGGATVALLRLGINSVSFLARLRGVIYDSTGGGGGPGALVAYTDETLLATAMNGTQIPLVFAAPVTLPAGNYWIGAHNSAGTTYQSAASGPASTYKTGDLWSDGANNPYGTPTGTALGYIRIEMPYYL